jgi:hypothetical protein
MLTNRIKNWDILKIICRLHRKSNSPKMSTPCLPSLARVSNRTGFSSLWRQHFPFASKIVSIFLYRREIIAGKEIRVMGRRDTAAKRRLANLANPGPDRRRPAKAVELVPPPHYTFQLPRPWCCDKLRLLATLPQQCLLKYKILSLVNKRNRAFFSTALLSLISLKILLLRPQKPSKFSYVK